METKQKIMVVDDQEDVLDSIFTVLQCEGYNVETASDGNECIEKMKNESINLVYLDIMMPKMDGYEVAHRLREQYEDKIKIIFISIKPKAEIDFTQANGFIQKPFTISEIINTTKKVLQSP